MPDQNQGPNLVPPLGEPGPAPLDLPSPPPLVDETVRRARRGLQVWLGTLLFLGAGSMLLGQPEAGGLVAIAGLFAAAHAADLDPGWRQAWVPLSFVAPLGGVAFFGYLVLLLLNADLPAAQRVAAVACATAGILVLGLSALPVFANGFVRRLF